METLPQRCALRADTISIGGSSIEGNSIETNSVWSANPQWNKSATFKITTFLVVIFCLLFMYLAPVLALKLVQFTAVSIIVIMASLRVFAVGLVIFKALNKTRPLQKPTTTPLTNWPRFTVLVPLYKEANVVKDLMSALSRLDYPHDKLDIIMVCEIDDHATWGAVQRELRPPFKLYQVGPSQPRTKPKALNSALAALPKAQKSDIITIYDAEDRPHPNQLKAAALALASDPNLAAVQAPLGYYNASGNLLTRFFALEYAALFHVWNPALTHLHLPYTLGGTSNHIRRHIVEAACGWDSYNVTEDADLSFKITAMTQNQKPLKIGCIDYGTQEEAVGTYAAWIHQRSRWLKGFMQTWAVHMRPKIQGPSGGVFHTMARIKNALSLQITIGATLLAAFLHVPSLLFIGALIVADTVNLIDFNLTASFFILMSYGYCASILSAMVGVIKEGRPTLIFLAPLMPLYWLLQFPAALIAAWEFVTAPSYWRKTKHKVEAKNNFRRRDLHLTLNDL
ncbi:MAG: glycosyltransferase [Robiginitomaculum sp.]|nr:glycosyltransferase [Robiginitomaculum sp.]